jgi:hypothetical protein
LQRRAGSGTLPALCRVNRLTGRGRFCRHGSTGRARAGIGGDPEGARNAELLREASISHDYRGQGHVSVESDFLVKRHMRIEIRPPIEALFILLGFILAAYGTLADSSRHPQSLGVNSNLTWGVVLAGCGAVRLLPGHRGMRVVPQKSYLPDLSGH